MSKVDRDDKKPDDYDTYRLAKTCDELLTKMTSRFKDLSVENNRYKAKKQMKAQRSFFRALCCTLESGDAPEMKIVLRGESVVLNTWIDVKRLEAFRASLGGGIATFLSNDTVVRQVFGLGSARLVAVERLSKIEKRLYRSPNSDASKARTMNRSRQRQQKNRRLGI